MKFDRETIARLGILLVALVAVQFIVMALGDLSNVGVSIFYWTASSFILLCGCRWAGIMPAIITMVCGCLVGVPQGIFPSLGLAFYFGMGGALYMTIALINLRRSPLWGIIISAVLRAFYMWLMFAKIIPQMSGPLVFTDAYLTAIIGWPQWIGSIIGGLASLPVLYKFYLMDQEEENSQQDKAKQKKQTEAVEETEMDAIEAEAAAAAKGILSSQQIAAAGRKQDSTKKGGNR